MYCGWDFPKHGWCRFENFPECLNDLTDVDMVTTTTEGTSVNWYMGLEIVEDPEGDWIRPYIQGDCDNENFQVSFHALIKFLYGCGMYSSHGNVRETANEIVFCGPYVKVSEIMKKPNGWLRDGALMIEYGIHLDAYHFQDRIWKFNLRDNWFNVCQKLDIKLENDDGLELFCSKKILRFHSKYFASKFRPSDRRFYLKELPLNTSFQVDYTDSVLQIAHGVRLSFSDVDHSDIIEIVRTAEKLKFRNVIRYCEQQMIVLSGTSYYDDFLTLAIRHNLNHYVAHVL
ncbi:unnamed protein product [Caenorhabditis nigoni]